MGRNAKELVAACLDEAGVRLASTRDEPGAITFECRFESGATLAFWLRPVSPGSLSFRAGRSFALGHAGESADGRALHLLENVARHLAAAEEQGWRLEVEERKGPDASRPHRPGEPVLIYGANQVELRVTTRCNEKCVFCNTHGLADNLVQDLGEARSLLERAKPAGARQAVISGGEPLLVPWSTGLVGDAFGLGFERVTMQTNGSLLCRSEVLDGLVESGVSELLVSIHGPDDATVSAISGRSGLYRAKMLGLRRALSRGLAVAVNFVVCKQNMWRIDAFVKRMAKLDPAPAFVSFSFVAPSGLAWENRAETVPSLTEAAPLLLSGLRLGRDLGLRVVHSEYCGIPTCVCPDLREFAEPCTPERPMHVPPDKEKPPMCDRCDWSWRCSGIFRRYMNAADQKALPASL